MRKTLWFDTETTGTDPAKHGLIEFSGLMEYDSKIVDQISIKMRAHEGALVSQEALTVQGVTIEEVRAYMPHNEGMMQIQEFFDRHISKYDKTDKFYPAGYNVGFDLDFLQASWKRIDKYGIGSYCNWKAVDPLPILRIMDYCEIVKLENYKLETVCSHLGIPITAHDSLSDIIATRAVMGKLLEEVIL